jgi:hypothetical protein
MEWLVPWHPAIDGTSCDAMVRELRAELCEAHILFGIPVRQIGHRQDCDDALFEFLDGTNRVAVVHLTFAQHPEPDPIWPETRIFENINAFIRDEMIPTHEEWSGSN